MALNRDKYDIEVRNNDAIKRNQIFFDFVQQMFNCLYGLYLRERCIYRDYHEISIEEAECSGS